MSAEMHYTITRADGTIIYSGPWMPVIEEIAGDIWVYAFADNPRVEPGDTMTFMVMRSARERQET